jgi:8-oxo-dGTP pyrophosphatase MutT (NUDIX family)
VLLKPSDKADFVNTPMSTGADLLNPAQTIRAVICYIRRGDDFLLLLKASGKFGGGFWNAPGGKIKVEESPEAAARREVFEETGLSVGSLENVGHLEFYFGAGKPRPDWTAEVFLIREFTGQVKESEEGKLEWFSKDNLPFDKMWQDDRYWLPLLVEGKKFLGTFEFSQDSKELIAHSVEEVF